MKVVSFSLWGTDPKYLVGAVENAKLVKVIYPGWTARFYVGSTVPVDVANTLLGEGAEVVPVGATGNWSSTFWRFYAASDPEVSEMISRDVDSRLCDREKQAVDQWLDSEDKLFHIMRDHPAHATEILAGMWGVKKPLLSNLRQVIEARVLGTHKQADQDFLRSVVYPAVKNVSLVHDPFFENKPFPTKRVGAEFVGQVFDEHNQPNSVFAADLMNDPRSRL